MSKENARVIRVLRTSETDMQVDVWGDTPWYALPVQSEQGAMVLVGGMIGVGVKQLKIGEGFALTFEKIREEV